MKLNEEQNKQSTRQATPTIARNHQVTPAATEPNYSASYDFTPLTHDPSIHHPTLPTSLSLTPTVSSSDSQPSFDRGTKPCPASHFTSSSGSLRMVNVPQRLTSLFLSSASSNSRRNLETCGILCGFLVSTLLPQSIIYFFISTLFSPQVFLPFNFLILLLTSVNFNLASVSSSFHLNFTPLPIYHLLMLSLYHTKLHDLHLKYTLTTP